MNTLKMSNSSRPETGTFNALAVALVLTVVFMASIWSNGAHAANYTAVGILTTQNQQMNYFKTEFVKIEGFKSLEDCNDRVKAESHSEDFIGKGGTNHKVPGLQWNFDANCMHINDE